jgi:hypothetical protein
MITKPNYKTILIIFAVLLCLLSYSFYTETIHHVFKEGNTLFGVMGTAGFIIILAGTSLFAYGGYIIYTNTIRLFRENEKLIQNIAVMRSPDTDRETKRKVRKENYQFLKQAWRPSFLFLGIGPLIIIIGAIILNIAEGTISL